MEIECYECLEKRLVELQLEELLSREECDLDPDDDEIQIHTGNGIVNQKMQVLTAVS